MVEFAIALPVFLILTIGIIEFGWYFFVQHTLQYATREGMRLALVGRTLTEGGTQLTRLDSIVKTIKEEASLAVDSGSLQISIYPVNPDFSDPSGWETRQDAGLAGDYMRVRTRYNHKLFTPLIGVFFTGGRIEIAAEGTYHNELFD